MFSVRDVLELKPSFMFHLIGEQGMVLDINTSLLINKSIWAGVSLRNSVLYTEGEGGKLLSTPTFLVFMGQLQVNEKLKVGASYDLAIQNQDLFVALAARFPFEIMLSYNLAVFEEQGVHTFLY